MRIVTIFLLIIISFNAIAQERNNKNIESDTYNLFLNQQWNELAKYSKYASQNNYYFFNVRLGIAYFNLKKYSSAEKYLKRAIKNNNIDFPKIYLFWNYINMGEKLLAEQIYNELLPESKNEINYNKSFIKYAYVEGGIKMPDSQNSNNIYYGNVSIGHRLFKGTQVNHSFNSYFYKNQGKTTPHYQYNFSTNVSIKNSMISIGTFIANNKVSESNRNTNINGTINTNLNSFYVDYSLRTHRLKIGASAIYNNKKAEIKYTSTTSQSKRPSTDSITTTQINSVTTSLLLSYTPKLFNDKLSLGAEYYLTFADNQTFSTIKPFIFFYLTKKSWINIDYIEVKDYLFTEKASEIIYYNSFIDTKRLACKFSMLISPKTIAKLTYTHESINNISTQSNYNMNSLFIGILFNF